MPLISSLGVMNAINFGLASNVGGLSEPPTYQIVASFNTPSPSQTLLYKFTNGVGYNTGVDYGGVSGNPVSVITNSTKNYMVQSFSSANWLLSKPISPTGIGTAAYPSTLLTSNPGYVFFSPTESVLIANVNRYSWSNSTGFGAKLTNMSTNVSGFVGTTDVFKFGNNTLNAYRWVNNDLGTQYADPSTTPTGGFPNSGTASPLGNAIVLLTPSSPYIQAYQFITGVGFGTRFTNANWYNLDGKRGVFDKDGTVFVASSQNSPWINAFRFDSINGFGTRFNDPATVTSGTGGQGLFFTSKGKDILTIGAAGIIAYKWDNGFGTKYTNANSPNSQPLCSAIF